MKAIIITIISSYVFIFIIGGFLGFLFPGVNDNPTTSFFGPVYMGFIFLSTLIVACTLYIVDSIRNLNKSNDK